MNEHVNKYVYRCDVKIFADSTTPGGFGSDDLVVS